MLGGILVSLEKIGNEQFVALMMLNQMKNESSKWNSGTFDIVMHSVLKSISDNESNSTEINLTELQTGHICGIV